MRLLFTGGGGAAREALVRLLPEHEVLFADADECAGADAVIPSGTHPAFIPSLTALCRRKSIDLIVPGVDEELRPIAMAQRIKVGNTFNANVLMPSYEFIGIHLDKLESMRVLKKAGIHVPHTFRYGILKPREGRGSRGVQRVGHTDGLIVQEALKGQEYTVTIVADKQARLRAIVPVKVELKRGVTIRGVTEQNDAVMEACWKIYLSNPTSGVYNVQGILTSDRGFLPFEINPRVSTTMCLALAAGVDVIGLALDDSPSVSNMLAPFKTVQLRRSWRNEFIEVAA